MLRTTTRQRGATSSPSAVELLDRTGIIAASLPQRRRRAGEVPEPMPIYTRPPVCDQDLRPKSVVIRRRVRAWLGSGAAVLLIGLGWVAGAGLGGGMLTPPADEVAQVEPNSAAAEPQPAPQLPAVVVQPQAQAGVGRAAGGPAAGAGSAGQAGRSGGAAAAALGERRGADGPQLRHRAQIRTCEWQCRF